MRTILITSLLFSLFPTSAYAATNCSDQGTTIIFVNGVFGDLTQAQTDLFSLQKTFLKNGGDKTLQFHNGYNPSHFAGGGDLIESISQAFGKPISNYDLDTILQQVHDELTTRKVLLVGHSQGSFYTNEMYDYLIKHGVPRQSIAVYNVATPAVFTAGGGQYLTSSNDKVINKIRDTEMSGNHDVYLNSYYTVGGVVASALRANIEVPKEAGWVNNEYGGHGFGDAYLAGAGPRIVSDINAELANLKVPAETDSADTGGCFTPPPQHSPVR